MANYAFKSGTMEKTVVKINDEEIESTLMGDLPKFDDKYIIVEDDENEECVTYSGESADKITFDDEEEDTAEMFTGGRPPHRPW